MQFGRRATLDELIIRVLAARPNLSSTEIQQAVEAMSRAYSPQAIFKALNALQEQSIIVRLKQHYSLSLAWTNDYLTLGNVIDAEYQGPKVCQGLVPAANKRTSWKFTNLLRLKNFWSQIVLALSASSNTKTLLSWNPRPLFYLMHSDHQRQVLRALATNETKMYKIIGGRTALDRSTSRFWDKNSVEFSFAEGPFEHQRSTFFFTLDDFLITVFIDGQTVSLVEELFAKNSSAHALGTSALEHLSQRRVNASLLIEHNRSKAHAVGRKFSRYFGVKFPWLG